MNRHDEWWLVHHQGHLNQKNVIIRKTKVFHNFIMNCISNLKQLVQLERLRSKDTPTAPWLPILLSSFIGSQAYIIEQFILDPKSKHDKVKVTNLKNLPKLQLFSFWKKIYTWHTFWSCFIRYVNMKWIRPEDTEWPRFCPQMDRRTRWNQYTPLQLRWTLYAVFHSHRWIQTGVTVWKRPIRVKINDFFCSVWPWSLTMTLKNYRAPLLCYIKLCASFHHHMWIQTGVTAKLGFDLCGLDLDLWPWPFAWASLLSMVTISENFMMIQWQEHCEKGVTDGRTGRRMEKSVLRAAWSQLKNH